MHFSVYSSTAKTIILGLFFPDGTRKELPMKRVGNDWHAEINEEIPDGTLYAYVCDDRKDRWLIDPYAKKMLNGKGLIKYEKPFDWQGVNSPNYSIGELIIYELHVKGFTKHPSSHVKNPGTFSGVVEKIPHLKKLGITAVELMPVFYFNGTVERTNPETKQPLFNYWGYNPIHFFIPMEYYGTEEEFKFMVRELHRNQIEVILDVVFNHTGEGNDKNFALSFKGFDAPTYYLINKDGNYLDYSGCGNTFHCNHPIVQKFILDVLHYWHQEMHVDGFRFDIGSVLTRGDNGEILKDPPIFKRIAEDPDLQGVKLIIEPWDTQINQQGLFPKLGKWSEWNAFFRDMVRDFVRGEKGIVDHYANVLTGSKSKFDSPQQSINFITCHDGFTLHDLVTYLQKRNQNNGYNNTDGANDNKSANYGVEGETNDQYINDLRARQIRNFLCILFLAEGVPMLCMRDEYGHTQKGNNNSTVQDNEISWFLWDELEKNQNIFQFVSNLIAFRTKNLFIYIQKTLTNNEIEWHGKEVSKPDWSSNSQFVAFVIKLKNSIYVAHNASKEQVTVHLPARKWNLLVNTSLPYEQNHLTFPEQGEVLKQTFDLPPYTMLIAQELS